MPYKKLSEQMQELSNPQRSDAFLKRFKDAVREGEIDAMDLRERFTLPKQYARRGKEETYFRDTRDMLFDDTAAFRKWFEQTDKELAAVRRQARPKPSLEAVESGDVDFKAMVEETRRKMQASYEKGRTLGQTRSKTRKKK